MPKPSEFGALLKVLLYQRGQSQEWLAEQIGVESASLSRMMRENRRPDAGTVLKIAEALKLSVEEQNALLLSARHPSGATSLGAGVGFSDFLRRFGGQQTQSEPETLVQLLEGVFRKNKLTREQQERAEKMLLGIAEVVSRQIVEERKGQGGGP